MTDPKFRWVARKSGCSFTGVIAIWVALLERASCVTDGDADVTRGDVTGFDCDAHDAMLDVDDGTCARILAAFVEKGMVSDGRIVNWEKRQPKREDSSAARTREYRARRNATKSSDAGVTNGDADVTQGDDKRREEEIRNIEAYASVNSDASASHADLLEQAETSLACPVDRIVEAYQAAMPDNPRVKVKSNARCKAIAARWREAARLNCEPFGYTTTADGLKAWRKFFEICAQSDFLTGRSKPMPGKPPFIANIDFLMTPHGFARCLENMYHREAA
ncbi:hypothetical protein [Caballeronia sp. BR00000012568055]|uniref:hypothetical protein n=1 Tax=Caballeronia sp. BR00000012568055 TaxID=2918761 RepID=UPI0023F6A276|nr:hypothetical protein [Caballeronia sp. BR00000012568055]